MASDKCDWVRFDPFAGEPFMRLLDPKFSADAPVPICRILIVWGAMVVPTIVFSLIDSSLTGGRFLGEFGYARSLAMWVQVATWAAWLLLLTLCRRLFFNTWQTLQDSRVIGNSSGASGKREHSPTLQFLRRATQFSGARGVCWIMVVVVLNACNFIEQLAVPVQYWWSSSAEEHSFFHFARIGLNQPNLAGIWHLLFASALSGYLILLIIRAYVTFSSLADAIAGRVLNLRATHPDRAGGLLPIGRLSLVMALFPFTSGVFLAALTFEVFRRGNIFQPMFVVLWATYLVLGPLLFFLPMLRLRKLMEAAKLDYVARICREYTSLESFKGGSESSKPIWPDDIKTHENLGSLYKSASAMAVWPFDRATLAKFVATYLSPVVPVVTYFWPSIANFFRIPWKE